jgi:hypothetical protein
MKMRTQIRLAVAGVALASAWASAHASTTNLVQVVGVALTGVAQSQIITNLVAGSSTLTTNIYTNSYSFTVSTRGFITDLGLLMGTNFTTAAQLLRVSSLTEPSNPRFLIRDVVDRTNVYFPLGTNQFQHGNLWSVTRSTTTNGKTTGTVWGNDFFLLSSATLGAALQGYTTTTIGSEVMNGLVQGSGAFTNAVTIYRGTITYGAQTLQTDLP